MRDDYQSRRISKVVDGSPASYYIYDGWNMIATYQIQNSEFTILNPYTWGTDLSGSMQGAGGVGGLLQVTDHSSLNDNSYLTYDGNGNVSEYIDNTGTTVAHYRYDPFGNTTVSTGTKANDFEHKFSTKPEDAETGLYYYGYRYYDPVTGRWPSRDPIEEMGGVNLYGFVENNGVNKIDSFGLAVMDSFKDFIDQWGKGTGGVHTAGVSVINMLKSDPKLVAELKKDALKELKAKAKCDSGGSGGFSGSVHGGSYTEPKLGRLTLKYGAICDWKCGKCKLVGKNSSACKCSCKINCDVTVSFSDEWNFTPYASDPKYKQWADSLSRIAANVLALKKGSSFWVTDSFDTKANSTYKKKCKK